MLTPDSRKPVNELTLDDLKIFPIWEYCLDEEDVAERDETWVRPFDGALIPAEAWSFQVAAEFALRDGGKFEGFVDVTTASSENLAEVLGEEALSQPSAVLIVSGCHIHVPAKTSYRYSESRDVVAKALARDFGAIFPIAYKLKALVEGETQLRNGELS